MINPDEPRETAEPTKLKDVFTQLSPENPETSNDTVQKLFNALSEHFKPQDILEEIWLHDIARITAQIEVFRVVERSVEYQTLLDRLNFLITTRKLSKDLHSVAHSGVYDLTVGGVGGSKMPHSVALEVTGALREVDIRKVASIADVIQKLQRERDRIYAQFERKRRPLVVASVKTVEAQVSAPNPTDKLAE
jgi:hypothetical protein